MTLKEWEDAPVVFWCAAFLFKSWKCSWSFIKPEFKNPYINKFKNNQQLIL